MAALRVAVDLTSLHVQSAERPSDIFQVRFVEALIQHLPTVDFVVMARPDLYHALTHLDGHNARRVLVADPNLVDWLVARLDARVPGRVRRTRLVRRLDPMRSLRPALARLRPGPHARLGADVAFTPFATPGLDDPAVPLVAAVHDLHHLSHAYLLSSAERAAREGAFVATTRRASAIVCSTAFVRDVALQRGELGAQQWSSVAPGRLLTHSPVAHNGIASTLARHHLTERGFLLLVADFEARHNHRVALTALAMYRAANPASQLSLVCVGGPAALRADATTVAAQMGLGTAVQFLGPLDRDEGTALIQASRAVVEPALYETVGETVLQAMHCSRPVLCSHIPGLTALVGNAALTFDPLRPADLAATFQRLERDPGLLADLAERGPNQLTSLGSGESAALAYLDVFRAAQTPCPVSR